MERAAGFAQAFAACQDSGKTVDRVCPGVYTGTLAQSDRLSGDRIGVLFLGDHLRLLQHAALFLTLNSIANLALSQTPPTPVTLNAYGDSITAGTGSTNCSGANAAATCYIDRVAYSRGWSLVNNAVGGSELFDQSLNFIWGSTVTSSTLSSLFIGENDGANSYGQPGVWQSALAANYVYLTTPTKFLGNTLTTTGKWHKDAIFRSGIYTTNSGATASGNVFAGVVYVVARSLLSNNPTFTVNIDGTNYGPYTPTPPWVTFKGNSFAPYLVRIPNLPIAPHTVQVINTSGELHVDFITGNETQASPDGPFLYVATAYKTATAIQILFTDLNKLIRETAAELTGDGLPIVMADLESDCANANTAHMKYPTGSACSQYDGGHPDDAGELIIANSFLRVMPGAGPPVNSSTIDGGFSAIDGNSIGSAYSPYNWSILGSGDWKASTSGAISMGADFNGALTSSWRNIRATNIAAGGYGGIGDVSGAANVVLDHDTMKLVITGNTEPVISAPPGDGVRFLVIIVNPNGYRFSWPSNVHNGIPIGQGYYYQWLVQTDLGSQGSDLIGVGGSAFQP